MAGIGGIKMTLKTIEKVNKLVTERKGLEELLRLKEKSEWVQIKYTTKDTYLCHYFDNTIDLSENGVKSLIQFVGTRIEEIDKELKELGVEEE